MRKQYWTFDYCFPYSYCSSNFVIFYYMSTLLLFCIAYSYSSLFQLFQWQSLPLFWLCNNEKYRKTVGNCFYLKKEGRREGEWITKNVIKSHAFLLDQLHFGCTSIIFADRNKTLNNIELSTFFCSKYILFCWLLFILYIINRILTTKFLLNLCSRVVNSQGLFLVRNVSFMILNFFNIPKLTFFNFSFSIL